jgi:alpha-tubulin suppressor-like RCC1 family protein
LQQRNQPTHIGTLSDWSSVTPGYLSSCGLHNGTLSCWGYNQNGLVGDGSGTNRSAPVDIGEPNAWSQVSLRTLTACALRRGALRCWGQVNIGTEIEGVHLAPVALDTATDWLELSVGVSYQCGRRNDGLYCWRLFNANDGTTVTPMPDVPKQFSTDTNWRVLSAYNSICGLHENRLDCWGANWWGQLGDGSLQDRVIPAPAIFP